LASANWTIQDEIGNKAVWSRLIEANFQKDSILEASD
jgi:hypothetical protein